MKKENCFLFIFYYLIVIIFISSCSKDVSSNDLNNPIAVRSTENQITTNCEVTMQGSQGYTGGPKIFTPQVNQSNLNQFITQMEQSGTFIWDEFMQKEYGYVYKEMAIYYSSGQTSLIKLPIFNKVTNSVSSFFTVQKNQNIFTYDFVERKYNDIRLQREPNNSLFKNNNDFFKIFDYGICNSNELPDFSDDDDIQALGDCITASGDFMAWQQYACDCECECWESVKVEFVTFGPCPPIFGSGGVYGGGGSTGGSTGGSGNGTTGGSTTNTVDMAIRLHNNLKYYYTDYFASFQALGYSSLAEAVSHLGPSGNQYGPFLRVGKAYERVKNATHNQTAILPIVAWLLKELAEFGTGAVIDFVLQFTMEYWMGDHSSLTAAWQAADIDELQVLFSGMEAFYKEKYIAMAASATADLILYLKNTKVDDINATGIFSNVGFGAISGFLGTNAADYVGKIGAFMVKYGPQKPFDKLKALNIHPFFFTLASFRSIVIEKAWANPGWIGRGRALEEISSYGRYKNMTWVNSAGETGGPLDYILGTFGVQLKTSSASTWSGVKQNAIKALDQLKQAKIAGTINSGRLDLMMPDYLSGNFQNWQDQIENLIATDYPGLNLSIIVGSFIE